MNINDFFIVDNWYKVKKINLNVYCVTEPGHVSFYIIKIKNEAVFIESGLGLCENMAKKLLRQLAIETFDVICTHAHCDHIGLNYLARNVYISQKEWIKYTQQNEREQLYSYIKISKYHMQWPNVNLEEIKYKEWQPTQFINDGELLDFE